jgi:putative hydrolase of the HAD superfamily
MNIVFDFGAVLFTWHPVDLAAECAPQLAPTPALAGHLAHEIFSHADWQSFDRGTLGIDDVVARTAQRLDLEHARLHRLLSGIGDRLQPMQDTLALLTRLKALRDGRDGSDACDRAASGSSSLKLYYLSNMPIPYARALERLNPFMAWFDGGIFSGDVQHIKPEPAIYQLLQTRHALEPARTVFIDDLLGNVQAAKGLGWHGIHFQSTQQVEQELLALNFGNF